MVVRIFGIFAVLALAGWPLVAGAENDSTGIAAHAVISEIQTGSAADAGQEFVELYNPTDVAISLDGWQLQYKSATGASWSKKAALSGSLPSHGFWLLSSIGYLSQADAFFASGLSGTAGHARLVDATGGVADTVGWGKTANAAETSPAPAPGSGQSIERVPGWLTEDGGNGVDSGDNSQDFVLRDQPNPQSSSAQPEVPQPRPDAPAAAAGDDTAATPVEYPAVQVTELLPDPASPQTDAADEFIELFNPGNDAVNVGGYVLKTGANFHASYILPQRVIEPQAYLAVYSAASHLSLPNTGGAVQLYSPAGIMMEQTASYGAAKPGQAFAADGEQWGWTLQPTPGDANVIVADGASPSAKKLSASKAAKTPKPAKPKAVKTTKPKPTTAKAKKSSGAPLSAALAAADQPSGHWLLITLAALTLGYILFEFRYDLQNLIYRAKGYRQARRTAGRAAARRGGN